MNTKRSINRWTINCSTMSSYFHPSYCIPTFFFFKYHLLVHQSHSSIKPPVPTIIHFSISNIQASMIPSIPTYLAHEELFFQPVFGSTGPRQAWLSVVGLAANHQAIEEEDVALVLGTYPCQRALHYKLVAALADVFALPAIDVPLDLVHLLDGQVLALHLLTVEAAGRLAREGEPRGKGKKKKRQKHLCKANTAKGGECKQKGRGWERKQGSVTHNTSTHKHCFSTLKIETLRLKGRLALSTVAVTQPHGGFSSA